MYRWREQGAWEWVMWKVLTCFKFNPAGLPRNRKVCFRVSVSLTKILEQTIPRYLPDTELLFGETTDDAKRHSPLSESWSTVIPDEVSQLPGAEERIAFSISLLPAWFNASVAWAVVFLCPNWSISECPYRSYLWRISDITNIRGETSPSSSPFPFRN